MGLFDKVSTDGTGTTGVFTQQVAAFAKLDLNTIFKMGAAGIASLITYAVEFFSDVFGKSHCNDQDRTLVERMSDQIPGMYALLSKQGFYDISLYNALQEDPNRIYKMMEFGMTKGAEPCNSLIYPARLLFTILFGVRIINQHFLDGLQRGVTGYYDAAGVWGTDIPTKAVERAVMLKQNFFPDTTYNRQQWDLNKFQDFPLVAPVPDPMNVGKFYTGEFLGIKIVNGYAVGDIIPDIEELLNPPNTSTGDPQFIDENPIEKLISYVKANPVPTLGLAGLLVLAYYEDENN